MKNNHQPDMQISEHELLVMNADLDDMHHDAMPKMQQAAAEFLETNRAGLADHTTRRGPSRRMFLLGAASLENLAVNTYQGAIDNAAKLGVPPAVATFAMTAQSQHKDHAAAWNSILTGAGKQAVTGVDQTVKVNVVDPAFAAVKTVPDLAKLALELENVAGATYLNGIQNGIHDNGAIKVAASIQPVEMQHAAILNLILGNYPIPDSFAKTRPTVREARPTKSASRTANHPPPRAGPGQQPAPPTRKHPTTEAGPRMVRPRRDEGPSTRTSTA